MWYNNKTMNNNYMLLNSNIECNQSMRSKIRY